MIEWGKESMPKKSLGLPAKPRKIPSTFNKFGCTTFETLESLSIYDGVGNENAKEQWVYLD